MKLILLYLLNLLPNLTLAQSNNTNNTSLNVANDAEQNYVLLIVCSIVVLAILLLFLYEKCCVYWNNVELFRRDSDTDVVDLRET